LQIPIASAEERRISSSQDLNSMIGFRPLVLAGTPQNSYSGQGALGSPLLGSGWMNRLRSYGHALAPLDATLPPLQTYGGRNDLCAQLAHGLANRSQRKAQEKAIKHIKHMQEGKDGGIDKRERKRRWVSAALTLFSLSLGGWGAD